MKKYFVMILIGLCSFSRLVNATTKDSAVYSGGNENVCSTKYQDMNMTADGINYFSHCMKMYCKSGFNPSPVYMYDYKVSCSNGNTSPKTDIVKSGCPKVGEVCTVGNASYCSVIIKYDCSKTSSGANFKTTTKKTTTKRRKTSTTTTTTTTTLPVSTKLKSLTLTNASIIFNSDVYEYSVSILSDINSIDITAIPEDGSNKVEVIGNTNLVNGSVIQVIVSNQSGAMSTYKINVTKEELKKSSNAKLSSLSVVGYEFAFDSKINEYSVYINEGTDKLDINYVTEDENATVEIKDNSSLVNGSRVSVKVIAEDGTENMYFINVFVKKKSNFIKYLFAIILVGAIGAGAYYIYKKFVNKTGDKYEYE